MRGASCPQCGSDLQEIAYGAGSVWACGTHGVKRWFFEDRAQDVVHYGRAEPHGPRAGEPRHLRG